MMRNGLLHFVRTNYEDRHVGYIPSTLVIGRALKSALLGALIGAMPWLLAYLLVTNPLTGDRRWALVMTPVFALVGAIVGALTSIALSAIRAGSGAASRQIERRPINTDPVNASEWENPRNWSGGVFYHSRLDKRILVPKRLGAFGYTVNLAHPGGRIVLAVLVGAALIAIAFGLRA
jgi:uncharacterized membrane protein